MKKILSIMLCLAIAISSVTAAYAAATELTDGFDTKDDYSKMVSHSDGMIFENGKKLGSYENASYVTSAHNVDMELVYKLEDMASFEIVTLNYKKSEGISFYVSAAQDGEYTQIDDYTTDTAALNSSWDKNVYTASGLPSGTNFLKITINQSAGGKYIRLDNVKIFADFELKLESSKLLRSGSIAEGNDIYSADTLVLEFNQKVNIPKLTISTAGKEDVQIDGKYGDDTNTVIYETDPLEFRIYTFTINDITATTGKTMNFSKTAGYSAVSGIPDYIHFGDSYDILDFAEKIKDSEENVYSAEEVTVSAENEEIVSIKDGKLIPAAVGSTDVNVQFRFNGENVKLTRTITVCGVKRFNIAPDSLSLAKGESRDITVEVVLEDDTAVQPEKLTITSSDETVVKTDGNTVSAVGKGNAFVKVKAEYHGDADEKTIPVGVDKETLATIARAQISANETNMVINTSAETVICAFSSDGSEMDTTAAECTYLSDNKNVIEISDSGRMYAKSVGEANVSATVNLGGAEVKTDSIRITVTQDYLYKAELTATNLYMLPGTKIPLGVKAYTYTGTQLESGLNISYHCDETAIAGISGNSLAAKAEGTAWIYATVSYNGKTVNTPKYEIKVLKNTGSMTKNFKTSKNWDGTLSHGDGLTIDNDGLKLSSGENQSVVFAIDNTINRIEVAGLSYGTPGAAEIKAYISYGENNDSDFTEIPLEVSAKGTGKLSISFTNNELYENVKYLRLNINGNSVRIESIKADYNTAPEVLGVTPVTNDYVPVLNSSADKLLIRFSQNIDDQNLAANISLKEKDSERNVEIGEVTLSDGVYAISADLNPSKEYILAISNVKNLKGTAMTDVFTCEIGSLEKKISVRNVAVGNSEITADIVSTLQTSVTADIVSVMYDENGYMTDIHIDRGYTISAGQNSYTAQGTYQGDTVKVYVWNCTNGLGY